MDENWNNNWTYSHTHWLRGACNSFFPHRRFAPRGRLLAKHTHMVACGKCKDLTDEWRQLPKCNFVFNSRFETEWHRVAAGVCTTDWFVRLIRNICNFRKPYIGYGMRPAYTHTTLTVCVGILILFVTNSRGFSRVHIHTCVVGVHSTYSSLSKSQRTFQYVCLRAFFVFFSSNFISVEWIVWRREWKTQNGMLTCDIRSDFDPESRRSANRKCHIVKVVGAWAGAVSPIFFPHSPTSLSLFLLSAGYLYASGSICSVSLVAWHTCFIITQLTTSQAFFFRLLIVHVKKQFFVCPLSRRELKSKVPFVVLWRWWTDRLVNGRKYIKKNCVNPNVKMDKWNIVTDYHLFRSGGPVFSLDCFSLDASMSGVVLIEFSMQCPSADRASMWPIGFIGRMWIYFSIFRFIVAQLIEYIRMWG